MKRTVMVLALVVVLALPALAAAAASETQQVRHAISWQRARTWHWQTVAGVRRSPTIRGAGGPHSVGYLRWIERRWNDRRVHAYKLAHRPTAYTAGIARLAGTSRPSRPTPPERRSTGADSR
jgi:Ni/Co efflux regulator RcnB